MIKDALMGAYGVVWKNNFSFDRAHAALGPNLTEVLNAFPFQVLHAPFLGPLLKEFLGGVGSVVHGAVGEMMKISPIQISEKMQKSVEDLFQDMIAYTSIWLFSSIADNYLGADLGFKAMESEKALIPLTASITGGKNTPIGNMANMNLFSLSENGFGEHMKAIFGTQLPNDVVAMFYSIFVTRIQGTVDSLVPSILKLTPPEKRGEVEKHLNEKIQGAKSAGH